MVNKELKERLFNTIECGVYLLTTKLGLKDNACCINSFSVVSIEPLRIKVDLNKESFTSSIMLKKSKFNISILSQTTPLELISRFGHQSGYNFNKFLDIDYFKRANNRIYYLDKYANAYLECKTIGKLDLGSSNMFICEVENIVFLNDEKSMTYLKYKELLMNSKNKD